MERFLQQQIRRYPFNSPGRREAVCDKNVLPRDTTQFSPLGLEPGNRDPETSAQTM